MKKTVRTIFVVLFWPSIVLLAPVVMYLLVAITGSCIPVSNNRSEGEGDSVEVYLINNGVHVDMALPLRNKQKDWSSCLDPEHEYADTSHQYYVSFGWGDSAFYRTTPEWKDLRMGTALNALFCASAAAMHVTFYASPPSGDHCIQIMMDTNEYIAAVKYISAGFKTDTSGSFRRISGTSYTSRDCFFEANGKYHLFFTSNTWTNECLKASAQKACLWTPFAQGLMWIYR